MARKSNTNTIITIGAVVAVAAVMFWAYKTGKLTGIIDKIKGLFNKGPQDFTSPGYTGPTYSTGQPKCLAGDAACYQRALIGPTFPSGQPKCLQGDAACYQRSGIPA